MKNSKNSYLPFLLLFIQPVFMASNLIVARGGLSMYLRSRWHFGDGL